MASIVFESLNFLQSSKVAEPKLTSTKSMNRCFLERLDNCKLVHHHQDVQQR